MDAGLGQGAGLVGAEDIHAPEVLDRGELFHDHLAGRHPHCTPRQGHGDHHGEEFGGQSHG